MHPMHQMHRMQLAAATVSGLSTDLCVRKSVRLRSTSFSQSFPPTTESVPTIRLIYRTNGPTVSDQGGDATVVIRRAAGFESPVFGMDGAHPVRCSGQLTVCPARSPRVDSGSNQTYPMMAVGLPREALLNIH